MSTRSRMPSSCPTLHKLEGSCSTRYLPNHADAPSTFPKPFVHRYRTTFELNTTSVSIHLRITLRYTDMSAVVTAIVSSF